MPLCVLEGDFGIWLVEGVGINFSKLAQQLTRKCLLTEATIDSSIWNLSSSSFALLRRASTQQKQLRIISIYYRTTYTFDYYLRVHI